MFFVGVTLVKFAFQGLNITLLGSLEPTDMKNNRLMFKSFYFILFNICKLIMFNLKKICF